MKRKEESNMRYISTRGEGIEKKSAQAIIQGLAGDKGLFVPVDIPKISLNPDQLKGKSYQEIAKVVLKLFFDDFSDEEIAYCVENAYDEKFEDSEIAPIKNAKFKRIIKPSQTCGSKSRRRDNEILRPQGL